MRAILLLTAKDIRCRLARPSGMLLNLAIPLVLAAMMAMVFGGGGEEFTPTMHIVVVDEDQGPIADLIKGAAQNDDAAQYLRLSQAATREAGLAAMKDRDATAMLVIPSGFGEALLKGDRVTLDLVKNPSHRILPIVAEQGAGVLALYLSAARRAIGDEAERVLNLVDGVGWDDAVGIAAMVTVIYARVQASDDLLFPPIITIEEETAAAEADTGGFNLMGWMFPGMIVMGLLFAGTTQMRELLEEARLGTLRRLLASPIGPGTVLLSKILSVGTVVGLTLVLFLVIGRLVFGIRWGPLPALAAVSCVVVIAVTGFGAMIFAVARTPRQGDAFGGILIMLMSLLGGAFVPPEALPDWLQGVARGTLNFWAHGLLRTLASGGGLADVAGGLAGLAAVGAAFTLTGALLLKRRHVGTA